jgi:hypothetical protein
MAVNANIIAGATPRPAIFELRLPWVWTFLAIIAVVGSLSFLYIRMSDQVSAANSYVLRLEAQLRSEQAYGDSLRADIAQMQTMEQLATSATSRLRMREASSQGVAYVTAPEAIARAGTAPNGRSGQVVAASSLADRPGQTTGLQAIAGRSVQSQASWWETIAVALAPARVAASEGETRR